MLHALTQHIELEEKIAYPLFDSCVHDDIVHSRQEHDEARTLIEAVKAGGTEESVFKLEEAIVHHVQEEEGHIFPDVENAIPADRLEEVGRLYETYHS